MNASQLPQAVLAALAPLPPGYPGLLAAATTVLGADARVRALWLSGSLATGAADRASDLDLIVTVRGVDRRSWADEWPRIQDAISPTVLARPVVANRVFTMLTPAWLRWDVVLEADDDLQAPIAAPRLAVFDHDGLAARLRVEEEARGPSPTRVRELVEEWFRVTGMPEVILVREDWLLATVHVAYLRDLVYRLMVEARRPAPARGLKWWSGKLSEEQRAALGTLPTQASSLPELIAAHLAISRVFLAQAESLVARLGEAWPTDLEMAARRHLAEQWGITEPYPRGGERNASR